MRARQTLGGEVVVRWRNFESLKLYFLRSGGGGGGMSFCSFYISGPSY